MDSILGGQPVVGPFGAHVCAAAAGGRRLAAASLGVWDGSTVPPVLHANDLTEALFSSPEN